MKNTDKFKNFLLLILFTLTCLSAPILAHTHSAYAQERNIFKPDHEETITETTKESAQGYNTGRSLEDIIASVIQLVLSVLGVIFIVLMFLTGNEWMQADGNEEKIKKAKTRLQHLIIGLIFVLLAYAVSSGFSAMLVKELITR